MATTFNPQTSGMGIGSVGLGDPSIIIKRKFRYSVTINSNSTNCSFVIPTYFVKTAARPKWTIEATELNFLNDKTWIPGKVAFEPITITFIDVGGVPSAGVSAGGGGTTTNPSIALYQWLVNVFNFTGTQGGTSSTLYKSMGSSLNDYSAEVLIATYDGCGNILDQWTLIDAWPESIDTGTLDYGDNEPIEIELSLRYSQASYASFCPDAAILQCCSGCGTSGGNTGGA